MSDQPGAVSHGVYDPSQRDDAPGAVATLKAPKAVKAQPVKAKSPEAPSDPRLCVGLPVQFHDGARTVGAVLTRENLTEPGAWDLKIYLPGASALGTRSGIRFAAAPSPGCFTLLPGWKFTG